MTLVSVDLDAVNRQAKGLLRRGRTRAAASILSPALAELDPRTAWLDERLLSTATLYLQSLLGHGTDEGLPAQDTEQELPVAWARYAARTSRRLHGLAHESTVIALRHLLWALCPGCTASSSRVGAGIHLPATWGRLLEATAALHGPHTEITLQCRYQRALALHQLGRCVQGTTELKRCWQLWHRHHGTTDITLLRGLATTLRECPAADDAARDWLSLQVLALPADHPAHLLVSARTAPHCTVCAYLRPGATCPPPPHRATAHRGHHAGIRTPRATPRADTGHAPPPAPASRGGRAPVALSTPPDHRRQVPAREQR